MTSVVLGEPWLGLATDALLGLDPQVDWATISAALAEDLHAPVAGKLLWTPGGQATVQAHLERPCPALEDLAARSPGLHPLARHYAATGHPGVLAIDQVPQPRGAQAAEYLAELTAAEIEQHLWLPLPPAGQTARIAGVCRPVDTFTPGEVALAHRIQPVIAAIVRHAEAMQRWRLGLPHPSWDAARDIVAAIGVTGREIAVLAQCARGLTADAIGRRLAISPRTVEKHLQNTYRKLNATDRVSALLRAAALGLLALDPAEPRSDAQPQHNAPT